ncbi:very short patch repair endonuclease [Enterobacteriaceae bacterium C23F]
MADVHNPATRSKNMRAIGTHNTAIEKRLSALLSEAGFTFTVQDASLPGKPDFVLEDQRCILFTHGCFWHHHDCYLFKVPETRTDFWLSKIGKNVERDARDIALLEAQGWRVMVVWECALRGRQKLSDTALKERLEEWICAGEVSAQIDTQGIAAMSVTSSPHTTSR